MVNKQAYEKLTQICGDRGATLVAVSKMKSVADIKALYDLGQRDFGENYVQELVSKKDELPADIRWHYIGHLQSNKVKYIASFVHLVHSIDSEKLLKEVNKQAQKLNRNIPVLLQVHIAREETKFGLDAAEVTKLLEDVANKYPHVTIRGLMGMASFVEDDGQLREEFEGLKALYDRLQPDYSFTTLSMGMSGDYALAMQCGSNMVRIGSLLFGARNPI